MTNSIEIRILEYDNVKDRYTSAELRCCVKLCEISDYYEYNDIDCDSVKTRISLVGGEFFTTPLEYDEIQKIILEREIENMVQNE